MGTVRAHVRTGITDRMLILGERHLRTILASTRATTTDGALIAAAPPRPVTLGTG
jgi:hypothetical protein